jgi:hypothetical protein
MPAAVAVVAATAKEAVVVSGAREVTVVEVTARLGNSRARLRC